MSKHKIFSLYSSVLKPEKITFFENVPASKEVLAFFNSCKLGNFALYQYEEYESQRILLLNTTLVGEQAIGSLGRFPGMQQDESEEGVVAIMTPAQFKCISDEWLKNSYTEKFTWYKDNKFRAHGGLSESVTNITQHKKIDWEGQHGKGKIFYLDASVAVNDTRVPG